MTTYPYPILNTLTNIWETPFFCFFIDATANMREQKTKMSQEISSICKSHDPWKASERKFKAQKWNDQEIGPNAVIFKIPKGIIILDADNETAEKHIENNYLLSDEGKKTFFEGVKFPSISCALGVKKCGYHYYYQVSEVNGYQPDRKKQYRNKEEDGDEKTGDLDILSEGNDIEDEKPSGWVIEYLDNNPKKTLRMDRENYLYFTNGWIYEEGKQKKKKTNDEMSADETNSESSEIFRSKFIDELPVEDRNFEMWREFCEQCPNTTKSRTKWLSVMIFFKKFFNEDIGRELFQIWSEKYDEYNESQDDKAWSSLNITKEEYLKDEETGKSYVITAGTPKHFFKEWAPELYEKWRSSYSKKTEYKPKVSPLGKKQETPESENYPLFIGIDVVNGGIYEMAEHMKNEIRKKAVYCLDSWYIFNDDNKLWMTGKVQPTTIIAQTVKNYFMETISLIAQGKSIVQDMKTEDAIRFYIDQKKKLDTPSATSQFTAHLRTLVLDNEFKKKLNQTRGKVVYKNGIYDIETNILRAGIFYDDFLTFTLPFNYIEPTPENKQKVHEILMKTNSQDREKYEYYIKMLGYSMTGYADREQCAFFCNGMSAGNGKSLIFESLSARMLGYVKKLQTDCFERDNSKRHKQFNDIDSMRILWVNEVSQKQQDVSFIKDISDGVPFKNEVMYGTEKEIDVQAKVFFVSNGEPKFASDEGIRRRYRYVEFCSKFFDDGAQMYAYTRGKPDINLHYIRDKTAPDFLKSDEGMSALLSIIYEGARLYLMDGLKPPARYEELKETAIRANNNYADFIDNFRECEGKNIYKDELAQYWECIGIKSKFNLSDCIQAFREKGYIYDGKKQSRVNGKVKTGFLMNLEFIEDMEDDE